MQRIASVVFSVVFFFHISLPAEAGDPSAKSGTQKPAAGYAERPNPLSILKPTTPAELSQDQIRKEMEALFSWGDGAAPYYFYLLSLPKKMKLKDSYVGRFNEMIGKDYLVNPYNNGPITANYRGPAITFFVPLELQNLSDKNGMCVRLDGFGDPLPIPAAEFFCANFHSGFVTRLVLGEYVRAWNKAGAQIDINSFNFALLAAKKQPIPVAFSKLESYQTAQKNGPKVETFDAGLEKLMTENDLASTGILWGWKAASELEAMRDKPEDQKYFQAAWRLVRNRFSPRQMGEISAFTMHYLLGFVKVAHMRGTNPKEANPQRDMSLILSRLAGDKDAADTKSLIALFHDAFLAEFYAITINPHLKPENKEKLLRAYFDFIRGWESGSLQAGDELFRRSFQLGYDFGFSDGFKDGYTRGYAAGCRDGYATGYKDAWSEANKVIDQLRRELAQAKEAHQGSGILGFIRDVASTVGQVVPVISAIIGLF